MNEVQSLESSPKSRRFSDEFKRDAVRLVAEELHIQGRSTSCGHDREEPVRLAQEFLLRCRVTRMPRLPNCRPKT